MTVLQKEYFNSAKYAERVCLSNQKLALINLGQEYIKSQARGFKVLSDKEESYGNDKEKESIKKD